jgi:IS30 family transposase
MARSFVQLSMDERRVIARMHEKKISQAEIARSLRRDRSTICRELRRNFWHDREFPAAEGYWHVTAHDMASARRRSYRKLRRDPLLCSAVIEQLKEGWSPEQIAGRLRISEGPARLCHETIYQYVYSSEGHDQQLARLLPERRRKRRPRYARKPKSLIFPIDCAIRNRPESINSRAEFGHWEADLMIFRKEHGSANVATVVERKSRYTVLFRNNDRRSKPIMSQLIRHLAPLPAQARQSLTI